MAWCNIFLLLSVIFMARLTTQVSALRTECVMNGKIVEDQRRFSYQVAIFGTPDHDSESEFLCSGALVSPLWILSTATCFVYFRNRVKPLIFVAVVGSGDITSGGGGAFQYIEYIYTQDYSRLRYTHDITMAKPDNAFELSDTISPIGIPRSRESFTTTTGVVSGYGSGAVADELGPNGYPVPRSSDLKLRYANVTYKTFRECMHRYFNIGPEDKFCGKTSRNEGNYTGMCSGDNGNPLVIRDKLVGLSLLTHQSCDDTNEGSLYIEVADYISFINNIIMGTPESSYEAHEIYQRRAPANFPRIRAPHRMPHRYE